MLLPLYGEIKIFNPVQYNATTVVKIMKLQSPYI